MISEFVREQKKIYSDGFLYVVFYLDIVTPL